MKRHILKILLISLVLFIPACGVWENFTTYFNLYYNTSDLFDQAEELILQQERGIFDTDEISVPSTANQSLNKVIEKTSKLLQFHGKSGYVDDALMMLGKSFYYQKNYLKALRKFEELTATQKESSLFLEAKLWIARTEMRLREYTDALNDLDTLKIIARQEGEDQILAGAYIEQIIYFVSKENYQEAIKEAEELIPVTVDDEQKAEVLYETGNFYIELKQPEKAVEYYRQVPDYSPKYIVLFNSQIALGRTLRDLNRKEDALDIFEGMRLQDKYRDNFDVIDYEIGITYLALDKVPEAFDALAYVDTSYRTSLYSGLARFNLGSIYENKILNYDSAAVYYLKAAGSQVPAIRVKEVQSKNQVFTKYKDLSGKIADARKQIFYIDNPEMFTEDSTRFFDSLKTLAVQDSIMGPDVQRNQRNQRTQTQTSGIQNLPPVRPTLPRDSIVAGIRRNKFNMANLFFGEMDKPDSAAKYYSEILNDSAAAEYHSKSLYAMGDYYLGKGDTVKADSIFGFIYENYRNDKVVNAAAVQLKKPLINFGFDPAEGIYTEAEKLWMDQKFDSALSAYKRVYEEYPKSTFAPKALLASGWIYENDLKIPDSAAVIYDSISVKFPGSIYQQKINPKLIAYKQEQQRRKREIEDSLRLANMKTDSLKTKDNNVVKSDSLSETERLQQQMQGTDEEQTQTVTQPGDSILTQQPKNDTLQPRNNQQNQERRNPRRRR